MPRVGAEAACILHFEGQTAEGKALFETEEILFRPRLRGGLRLVVPLKAIRSASAQAGVLRLAWGTSSAELHIGPAAAKWLEKIKNPKGRLDKLGVKAGQRIALAGAVGAIDDGFAEELAARGADVVPASARAPADLIFFVAEKREALNKLATIKMQIVSNGAIWVLRPKGSAEIGERDVFDGAKAAGLVDVKVVAFSEKLSAAKLVVPLASR